AGPIDTEPLWFFPCQAFLDDRSTPIDDGSKGVENQCLYRRNCAPRVLSSCRFEAGADGHAERLQSLSARHRELLGAYYTKRRRMPGTRRRVKILTRWPQQRGILFNNVGAAMKMRERSRYDDYPSVQHRPVVAVRHQQPQAGERPPKFDKLHAWRQLASLSVRSTHEHSATASAK